LYNPEEIHSLRNLFFKTFKKSFIKNGFARKESLTKEMPSLWLGGFLSFPKKEKLSPGEANSEKAIALSQKHCNANFL